MHSRYVPPFHTILYYITMLHYCICMLLECVTLLLLFRIIIYFVLDYDMRN